MRRKFWKTIRTGHYYQLLLTAFMVGGVAAAGRADAATIGFLYALDRDWQAFVQASGGQPVSSSSGDRRIQQLTTGKHVIWAVKMGSGCAETAVSTTCLLHKAPLDLIITAGPAGALTDSLVPGTLVVIDRMVAWQTNGGQVVPLPLPSTAAAPEGNRGGGTGPHWKLSGGAVLPGVVCASGEFFVNTAAQRQELAVKAQIVDMNTYGVETAAAAWKVPCVHLRVVSDRANEAAREDFLAFGKTWDGRCGTLAWQLLTSLKPDPTRPQTYEGLRQLLQDPAAAGGEAAEQAPVPPAAPGKGGP